MKKIIIIVWIFILSSCGHLWDLKNQYLEYPNSNNISKEGNISTWIVLNDNIKEKINTWQIIINIVDILTWSIVNTGSLDSETFTWSSDDIWKIIKKEILSIEEQYCLSKWGKVVLHEGKKICYTTDLKWLLKCDVDLFYNEQCRDKFSIIENGIVVDIVIIEEEPEIEVINTWSLNIELWVNKIADNTVISEKKVIITETIIKEQQWRSWKYFIIVYSDWKTELKMITNEWVSKSIFSKDILQNAIYNYELLINKQIKVFYYWTWNIKSEETVDLNNL